MLIQETSSGIVLSGDIYSPRETDDFARVCKVLVERTSEITIDFQDIGSVFPNARVPIAAIIHHYKTQKGCTFHPQGHNTLMGLHSIVNPLTNAEASPRVFTNVWQFDQDTAHILAAKVVEDISQEAVVAAGSLEAFHWCLWEVMDNVALHSKAGTGFFEVQVHKVKRNLAICIADAGIGIWQSLHDNGRRPRSSEDAITFAMGKGATSNPRRYRGNGLWGLYEIVTHNRSGRLSITSGSGSVVVESGDVQKFGNREDMASGAPGTVVDIQLGYNSAVNLGELLGYTPLEEFGQRSLEASGNYIVSIRKDSKGTATRKSGAGMFNMVKNLLQVIPGQVVVDFDGVSVISSSFADEFVGKLVRDMGFTQFSDAIRLANTSSTVGALLDKAIASRLTDTRKPTQATRE